MDNSKLLLTVLFLFIINSLSAQIEEQQKNFSNVDLTIRGLPAQWSVNSGAMSTRYTAGSSFLFEDWNNITVLTSENGEKLKLKNSNLFIDKNEFQTKSEEGEVYTLDGNFLKTVVINNRIFEKINFPQENGYKFLELVFNSNEKKLLKEYSLVLKENRLNASTTESVLNKTVSNIYYVKTKGSFKAIKINKSSISNYLGISTKELKRYLNSSKLTLSNDEDLKELLRHFNQ